MNMNRSFGIKRKKGSIPHSEAIHIENRKYPRLPLQLPAEYSRKDSFVTRFAHTINICESGIFVRLPEKFELGESLRVKVYFDMDFDLYSIEPLAEVVWLDGVGQQKKEYRCGLEFIEMSNEDLKKIARFMENFF